MHTNKIMIAAISTFFLSGVACSKKIGNSPNIASEAIAEKVERDCSALMTSWDLSQKTGSMERITFFKGINDSTIFSFSGKDEDGQDIQSPILLVNGQSGNISAAQIDASTQSSSDFQGSCVDGQFVLDMMETTTENLSSDSVLDVKKITTVTQRLTITPDESDATKATLSIQEIRTMTLDDPKGSVESEDPVLSEITTIELTKAALVDPVEEQRQEQLLMRQQNKN